MCMKDIFKRKQFILPQKKLAQVKKLLKARTETEAVILSLDAVLRRKNLEELLSLPRKIHFDLSHKELKRQRTSD